MVAPFSLPIKATRFSHSTASKGDFLPSVKWREKVRPSPAPAAALSTASAARVFPLNSRLAYRGRVDPRAALDSARLALPHPPNLELQYRRMRKACQEENARYG